MIMDLSKKEGVKNSAYVQLDKELMFVSPQLN